MKFCTSYPGNWPLFDFVGNLRSLSAGDLNSKSSNKSDFDVNHFAFTELKLETAELFFEEINVRHAI